MSYLTENHSDALGTTFTSLSIPATFYRNGELKKAVLTDVNECGAEMHAISAIDPQQHGITEGRDGEYYVSTNYGTSKYRGTITNVNTDSDKVSWKVRFTELSDYALDPLRRIIRDKNQDKNCRSNAGFAMA